MHAPSCRRALAAVAGALLIGACGPASSAAIGPSGDDVSPIDLVPQRVRLVLLPAGTPRARQQLSAVLRGTGGKSAQSAALTWSTDSDLLDVDAGGLVTSRLPGGPVHVTATHRGAHATATVCSLLLQNDFERDDTGEVTPAALMGGWGAGYYSGRGRVRVVAGDEAFAGGRSLRIEFPRGGVGPEQSGAIWVVPLGGSYDELFASYSMKFGEGFDFVLGGKIPGLAGGAQNTGGNRPNGRDGWSARGEWTAGGEMVQYVYHPDQPGNFGQTFAWKTGTAAVKAVPGRWYHVEQRVVMNTPGKHDGIVQTWVDGVLVMERHSLRFRDVDTFGIDALHISTFFGGSEPQYASRRDEVVYFDNFVVSRFRVGPGGSVMDPDCQPDSR
jgi:hypothetical protein